MADNKLNINILRQAIVNRTDATDKEASLFLKTFAEQIVEGLKSGEQVKINGLGTFRLQEMAPRKSVDVNTGEAIVIPGYKKMVFSPEVSIREMVENNGRNVTIHNPNETIPATVVDEEALSPIEKLGRQADEIVDLLADLGQGPKAAITSVAREETVHREDATALARKTETEDTKTATQTTNTTGGTAGEDNAEENNEQQETLPTLQPEEQKEQEETHKENAEDNVGENAQPETETATDTSATKKRFHFWRDTLICVVCLLVILLGGFFVLQHTLSGWIDTIAEGRKHTVADTIAATLVPTEPDTLSTTADTTTAEKTLVLPTYTAFITTEKINEGSRLTWLAYRYYGNKALWLYIYDANKDHLDNPNNIKVGTPIRIPKLTEAQKDTTIASTREVLKALEKEAARHNQR